MDPEWLCTYRLQLNASFPFGAAAEIAAYLAELGVSHVYLSPVLQAAPGSTHGYDVADPTRLNDELGGEAGYRRLCEALAAAGLGQLLDIVPNHMATSTPANPWWWDVLKHGSASAHARDFDLGWRQDASHLAPIRLPVLGERYGRVLASGDLGLWRTERGLEVTYFDAAFPLTPRSYAMPLRMAASHAGGQALAAVADLFASEDDEAEAESALARLLGASAAASEALDAGLEEISATPALLHELLEQQHYRLSSWRVFADAPPYRRFFAIHSLIGLRVEDPALFETRHRIELGLAESGLVQGLRVDHIDGLRDPRAYLQRLRARAPGQRLLVEKILGAGETLPRSWPVDGTTGYEFLVLLNGLFVHPEAETPLTELYGELSGDTRDYAQVLVEAKRFVLQELFSGELDDLVALFERACEGYIDGRDWLRRDVESALRETLVALPVYRTYVFPERKEMEPADREIVEEAMRLAAERAPEVDPNLFGFLRDLLLLRRTGRPETEFVLRLQQLSGPVMAKGAEDTAFYRYNRLISLCEVGGDPGRFGTSLQAFHDFCKLTVEGWPRTMLSTATHDTKRGEDNRLRIDALSEAPGVWWETVTRWTALNAALRRSTGLDRNTEYLLYQTLVGAWPVERQRLQQYATKAVREAKLHTAWDDPVEAYEAGLGRFVDGLYANQGFMADCAAFVAGIDVAARQSSLSQTLIRLTAPGVPDIYQGCELWDHSLVDPDNRRPVDYRERRRLLARARTLDARRVMGEMASGLPKLWLIWKTLALRKAEAVAFASTYEPLYAGGAKADHVVAFLRGGRVITVAPRWPLAREAGWADAWLALPEGSWRNHLTGARFAGTSVPLRELLSDFPVALLVRE